MDASLQSRAEQLAGEIASQARTAEDLNGLMRLMMKSALERMLNTEMDVHLGRKVDEDSPVAEEEPISLSNVGHLKHAFVLSKDVLRMTDVDTMTREVSYFKEAGGSAIVDMSTPGIRCDLEGTREISENTGVHIVAPTGIYTYDTWPDQYKEMDVQELTAYMLNEVESGIEGTDIYPGHIKVALDVDNQPQELAAIKAAARVSLDSNLPVTVGRLITWPLLRVP